jgi:hypothetical protein
MTNGMVRSARGELVNFDLLKIKQQMVSAPKPIVVEARESFIDNKFKRQLKRQTLEAISMVSTESTEPSITDEVPKIDTIKSKPIEHKGK